MARRHVKVLCTPSKTSIYRPWGIHAKHRWLCLLHNGSAFRQSTSALDNQVQVLQSMFLRAFSTSHFIQGQSGHRVRGPFPPSPRLLLPCRGLTCGSETSGDPVLVCVSSAEGVRMTHELWWGVNMECKKSKGIDISEYSYTAVLFFAIH